MKNLVWRKIEGRWFALYTRGRPTPPAARELSVERRDIPSSVTVSIRNLGSPQHGPEFLALSKKFCIWHMVAAVQQVPSGKYVGYKLGGEDGKQRLPQLQAKLRDGGLTGEQAAPEDAQMIIESLLTLDGADN
jgi:hypothetical protein